MEHFPKFKAHNTKTDQETTVRAPDKEAVLRLVCSDQERVSPELREAVGWWDRKDVVIEEIKE